MEANAVEFRNVTKRFGQTTANDSLSFSVGCGSIHGIVGENGAGKSTAMRMLYGMIGADSGEILVNGSPSRWRSPQDAIAHGIGMVHQHFMLAEPMTALDNALLGFEWRGQKRPWWQRALFPLERTLARQELTALAKSHGIDIDLDLTVRDLNLGAQQRLEILKALYRKAQILILDEPTAVLTPLETQQLFENLRHLRDEGKTILIITHKLREILALTDQVTVFRQGRVVANVATKGQTIDSLATLMVGRKIHLGGPEGARKDSGKPPAVVLSVQNVTVSGSSKSEAKPRLDNVSLNIKAGEILGIAGVEGNGQQDLIEAILALTEGAKANGSMALGAQSLSGLSTATIRDTGVAVIPANRQHEGLIMDDSIEDNLLLGQHRRPAVSKWGWLRRTAIREHAKSLIDDFDIKCETAASPASSLSGGNQQKIIIAREINAGAKLLIAAQPTRGVDVGAIEHIHQTLREARDQGAAVLLISSDLDELLALSDRIAVMFSGRVVAEFSAADADEQKIGRAMGGG